MVEISKIEVNNRQPNIIEIDGIKYALERETIKIMDGIPHADKLIYKKFDEKQYKKDLKIVVAEIFKRTTKKELLNEILGAMDVKTLKRLVRRIKSKKPIKKQEGCLGFKIGDAHIQLIE